MRRPRLHVPGGCYHVTLRGNHSQDIFFTEDDRARLETYVADALGQVRARIHAYCWMTNHIHLLIQVGDTPLGAFMQRIASRYARAAQERVPTTGHLFQNRYHALLVDVDRYFLALLRYIHLNPVRAGLVADPAEYHWSSHRAYLGLANCHWLETDFGLRLFGAEAATARTRYQTFVAQAIGAPRDPRLSAPARGEPRVLGDDGFVKAIAARTASTATAPARALDDIAAEVCGALGVTLDELRSAGQARRLTRARGVLTARALADGAASLGDVSRYLNRSGSALARAAERYRGQGER